MNMILTVTTLLFFVGFCIAKPLTQDEETLQAAETIYGYPSHHDSLSDHGYGSHGLVNNGYGVHGSGHFDDHGQHGVAGYGSQGHQSTGGHGSHSKHGAHGSQYGKYHDIGSYAHDKGSGYEKAYHYDKNTGYHNVLADHGAHSSGYGSHGNNAYHKTGSHGHHGRNVHGSHAKLGNHGYGNHGYINNHHGHQSNGHSKVYFHGPGYGYQY